MKKLIFLLALLPIFSFAQEYSEIVEIPGKTAGQLYSIAREWFAKSFISADNALLMDDVVSGKIIAKGSVHISESYGVAPVVVDWYPNFTIKVAFKDGRYRSEISDISITRNFGRDSTGTTTAFKKYFDKKDYYKNKGDTTWLLNNPPPGIKIRKAAAKTLAEPNRAIYNLICKTESEMLDILSKLKQEMKKSEDKW